MERDHPLQEEYIKFMTEYENLGHMRPIAQTELKEENCGYYIPHHGIWQNFDTKRKLRVVFNASKASSTGYSLNDLLHSGKKLQNDIASILLR